MNQFTTFGDKTMSNQAVTNAKSMSRQEYNRLYYLRTKERRAMKKKWGGANVLQLFSKGKGDDSSGGSITGKLLFWLEIIVLICLNVTMTFYLVKEAAVFYLDAQDPSATALLKSVMVEGVSILFSFSRGKNRVLRWAQRIVVVLLCSLNLWTLSSRPVKTASSDVSKVRMLAQVVRDLEVERAQKEELRNQLVQKEWLGAARRYEKGLDEIRVKLAEARKELNSMPAPQVVLNSLGILIAFRLLVVVANLICFHRLAEQLGFESVRKPYFSTAPQS